MSDEEMIEDGEAEEFAEPDDVDPDELAEDLEEDLEEDGEAFVSDDDFTADDDDDDDEATTGPVRRSVAAEDEDEDEDLLAPDDVEADLDTILKDRLVAAKETNEDEEDDEPDDRTETGDRLQPKRADERLCSSCFLLVRQGAPVCPVGDDDCPIFS